MGLKGWYITWSWDSAAAIDADAHYPAWAITSYDQSTMNAHIRISKEVEWQVKSKDHRGYLTRVIVHELAHIRLASGDAILDEIETVVKNYLPQTPYHTFCDMRISAREHFTEALTWTMLNMEESWQNKR